MKTLAYAVLAPLASLALVAACSSSNKPVAATSGDGGTLATCASPAVLNDATFCSSCTFSASANPATCQNSRPVNACCAWVQEPQLEAVRSTDLHYNSAPDGNPAPNLTCITTPVALGTPKTVTLTGHVKLFSSGNDSAGVKIEIFKEGPNGALGDAVGTAFVTTNDDATDPPQMPLPTWSSKCPTGGCSLRSFSYPGVPTETPLIIKTSDATGTGNSWSDLYDYNVYIANTALDASGNGTYDPSAVAATDVNTVASAAGGFTVKADKGVLAGEVHDCADVRISGAMVDTDLPHEGEMFYFNDVESDPLPDKTRAPAGLGTSKLGLFGALNIVTGTPMTISAVIRSGGQDVLLGTYTVQLYPGAVTALSFRGRRPWQK